MNFSQVFENQNFLAKFIDEGILLSVLYVLIFIILFLFYILVFPFYVYVNKVNKERDKNVTFKKNQHNKLNILGICISNYQSFF